MKLEEAIRERAGRKGLTVTLAKMRYTVEHWVGDLRERHAVLDVGCGHGHFLVLLCKQYGFERGVGIDPYVPGDGNEECDHTLLLELMSDEGLSERVSTSREPVQHYLGSGAGERFSLILAADVLHHIFPTKRLLHEEAHSYRQCVELLSGLRNALSSQGVLVVDEVERHGLRCAVDSVLGRRAVDWSTKQPHGEWCRALREAGFSRIRRVVYVPHPVRVFRPFLSNAIGAYLMCPRYFLICRV